MKPFVVRTGVAVTMILALLVTGCASSPDVEYYTLSPQSVGATSTADESIALAVGPADFPRALSRVRMMTRSSDNRVTYDEFNRWAGTLETDFLATTATNLSRLLGSDRVVVYPTPPSFVINYRVTFDVQRFDADANGNVTLDTRWSLVDGETGDVLELHHFSTTKSGTADDYESSAAAHSAAAAELSKVVADHMRNRANTG
ncbi:MAG: PqiC family protein [Gammaproteobacteria bacterium]